MQTEEEEDEEEERGKRLLGDGRDFNRRLLLGRPDRKTRAGQGRAWPRREEFDATP
jgi:hypothetical protein